VGYPMKGRGAGQEAQVPAGDLQQTRAQGRVACPPLQRARVQRRAGHRLELVQLVLGALVRRLIWTQLPEKTCDGNRCYKRQSRQRV